MLSILPSLCLRNISFRGISLADGSHSMAVGDSATILISDSSDSQQHWLWHALLAPCNRSHTFNAVSYYDSIHAAIVADAGLIFTTSDAGAHWLQSGAGMTGQTFRAITFTAKGGLIVVGDSGIILQSLDSGGTWTRVESNTTYDINSVVINDIGRGYFAGAHGLIGRTTDFGSAWTLVSDSIHNLNNNGSMINFRGIAIGSGWDGMAVGDSGGFAQTTNGMTWNAIIYSVVNDTNAWRTIDSTSYSSIVYCGFAGITWLIFGNNDFYLQSATENYVQTPVFQGDADGGSDYSVIRAPCVGIWRGKPNAVIQYCSPYEVSWTSVDSGNIASESFIEPDNFIQVYDFLFTSIDSFGKGFSTGVGGRFSRTTDNGLTWNSAMINTNYKATDVHIIDSSNAFAVGWSGACFRTTDGGVTWDSTNIVAANQERLHSIANPAANVYVVSGDFGTVIRSTDNAATWSASVVSTTNYLETIAFSTTEIGIAAGENGTIIRTTDQGVTWMNINNQLTGTDYSYRQLQAFPSGTYYVTTDSAGLWRSTDQGMNWLSIPNAPKTMGMAFLNDSIGVVAEYGIATTPWDTGYINDTARLAFTTNGFATVPIEFNVPIINNNRMAFHFLDSNTFLCFGSDGFVVRVDMSQGSASITLLTSMQTSLLQAFPNPSATHSTTIEYDLNNSGSTTIELWNELGEKVQTLFVGSEQAGHHSQQLKIDPDLHGSFFVKVISGTELKTLPIVIE